MGKIVLFLTILCWYSYCESKPACSNPDPEANTIIGMWDFGSASDTSKWVFENLQSTNSPPKINWLSNYEGIPGVLKLQYAEQNQGTKITLTRSEWLSSSNSKWYRMRTRIKIEGSSSNSVFIIGFLYNGMPPGPTDINGSGTTVVTSKWITLESYMQSVGGDSCMYCQFVIKNNNKLPLTVYLDSAEVAETDMPDMMDINFAGAGFKAQQNVTEFWQYEKGGNWDWRENYEISSNQLDISFGGGTMQGMKMTMGSRPGSTFTHPIHRGKLAGQRARVFVNGNNKNLSVVAWSFGIDKPNNPDFKEMGVAARLNRFVNGDNGNIQTIYSTTQPYIYGQMFLKSDAPNHVLLDDLFPQVEK